MNLENLGVQEMSAQEVKQVEGGILPMVVAFVFFAGLEAGWW